MIDVLCVDDHPALRAGLLTVLRLEPGIVPRQAVGTARDALEAAGSGVDLVLADYRLPDLDGLELCRRLKELEEPPRVLLYSAHALAGLALPARLAGADGLLDKGAPAEVLFEAIRVVARGGAVFPESVRELAGADTERLDTEDLPILGMVADGATLAEVAEVMRIEPEDLSRRIGRMIELLKPQAGVV